MQQTILPQVGAGTKSVRIKGFPRFSNGLRLSDWPKSKGLRKLTLRIWRILYSFLRVVILTTYNGTKLSEVSFFSVQVSTKQREPQNLITLVVDPSNASKS